MGGELVRLASICLALLAVGSVVAARRSIAEAWCAGHRLQAAGAQVLVTGGILTETAPASDRALMQVAVVATFLAIQAFAELSDPRLSRYRGHIGSAPIVYNQTPVTLILLWVWLYGVNLWFTSDGPTNNALYRTASGVAFV